jgi:hypothetical protein
MMNVFVVMRMARTKEMFTYTKPKAGARREETRTIKEVAAA